MRKIFRAWPFLLFILLLDRFFLLPARMDAMWQYESGVNAGDIIFYDNIEIISNLEIVIHANKKSQSFYLLGCYFGNLYLLETRSLEYTKYGTLEMAQLEFNKE
ncbi:hypothetical protein [Flavobacterium sp.]